MNLFNCDKEFFFISSENLDNITTKLYGFTIQDNGIIENANINCLKLPLGGIGAYVYIERTKKHIKIHQDFNGSYGLYYFKRGNYFALSNSFLYLIDHIKDKFNLTFNHNFANYMYPLTLCSEAYKDTLTKDIVRLDKDIVLKINLRTKKITTTQTNWEIRTQQIDSEQGVQILDTWFEKWTKLFRVLKSKTNNITVALSGGLDSRLTFCLALMSGIDLKTTRINSINDSVHKEDFNIASEIAKYFDFELNKLDFTSKPLNFSFRDIMRMVAYVRLPFHKELHYNFQKQAHKYYVVGGDGGENLRKYYDVPASEIAAPYLKKIDGYKNSEEIKQSFLTIFNDTIKEIQTKYNIDDISSKDVSSLLYMNARACYHFGSGVITEYFKNHFTLTPLLDPLILKLKLNTSECQDSNLLIATIFSRYCPKLLDFKIQGNRFIEPSTIEFANKINKKYPVDMNKLLSTKHDTEYNIITTDKELLNIENTNEGVPVDYPDKFLKSIFDSEFFEEFITKYFDQERYNYAKNHYNKSSHYRLREIYSLIANAMIIKIIEQNKKTWTQNIKRYFAKLFKHKNN